MKLPIYGSTSMVLLAQKGLSADDVLKELARREGVSGIEEKANRK